MLGKLIKNEFKQTSQSLIAVYSAAGIAILFMLLSYVADIAWIGATGSFALVVIGFAAIAMTLIMVISNFARSLYSNQGYLSFTLPVKCSSLLFSKFIVAFVWIIVGYVVAFLTILIVVLYARSKSNGMIESFFQMAGELQVIGDLPTIKLITEYVVTIGVGSIITVVSFIAFVYFAITLANTRKFQHKPLLFGIIFFFAVYGINKAVSTFLTYEAPLSLTVTGDKIALSLTSMSNAQGVLFTYGVCGKLFTAVFAALLLIITGWIMEKKVNVK